MQMREQKRLRKRRAPCRRRSRPLKTNSIKLKRLLCRSMLNLRRKTKRCRTIMTFERHQMSRRSCAGVSQEKNRFSANGAHSRALVREAVASLVRQWSANFGFVS